MVRRSSEIIGAEMKLTVPALEACRTVSLGMVFGLTCLQASSTSHVGGRGDFMYLQGFSEQHPQQACDEGHS